MERMEECKDEMFDLLLDNLSDLKERLVDEMREKFGGDLEGRYESLFRGLGSEALEGISESAVRERISEAFDELMVPDYETQKARAEVLRKEEKKEEMRREKALIESMRDEGAESRPVRHNLTMERDVMEEEREALAEYFKTFEPLTLNERRELLKQKGGFSSFATELLMDYEDAEYSEKEMRALLNDALSKPYP
jgi:hypothetical protein